MKKLNRMTYQELNEFIATHDETHPLSCEAMVRSLRIEVEFLESLRHKDTPGSVWFKAISHGALLIRSEVLGPFELQMQSEAQRDPADKEKP